MTRVVSLTPLAVERDSRTFKQATSMARLGFESVLIEGSPSSLDRDSLPFQLVSLPRDGTPTPSGPAARALNIPRKHGPGALRRIAMHLWRHGLATAPALPPAPLYYLHGISQFPAVYLACRRRDARFIYDAHDFYPPQRREVEDAGAGDRLIDRFLLIMEKMAVRRAAEVITTSEGNAEQIEHAFGRRPAVVMNGHDPRMDEEPSTEIRTALDLTDDTFLIVVPGNEKRGAAIAETIEAAEELPERVHLAFLGAGYERFAEQISQLGLDDRVHILAPVPPNQFAPFIASADLVAIPYVPISDSYRHAIGNRFFVPLSVGLPLLYPKDLPDLAALAIEYEVGLPIEPRRVESIVDAVRRLLDDPGLLHRFAENAERAGTALSWERDEERLGSLVGSALA
jgi:glycosyltransferase involved in cell wall biosynthesis